MQKENGKDGRRKQFEKKVSRGDERKAAIAATMRATKEIGELPKNVSWKTDGGYMTELIAHVYTICERTGLLPTMNLLASAVGVPKDVIDDVRNGFIGANPDVVSAIIGFYQVCENTAVQSTLDGSTNNIGGIFLLKSQYGFKEEPREVVVTHNKLLGERKDPKAIAERYAQAVIDAKPDELTETEADEAIDW